jgi:hypothetical protein
MSDAVQAYYASLSEREWARLTTPIGAIELAVHTRALENHLPPRARVLNTGGGPARYALWAAPEGIAWGIQDAVAEMSADDPEAHRVMLDLVIRTADDPSILGASDHLLYVGRKVGR